MLFHGLGMTMEVYEGIRGVQRFLATAHAKFKISHQYKAIQPSAQADKFLLRMAATAAVCVSA